MPFRTVVTILLILHQLVLPFAHAEPPAVSAEEAKQAERLRTTKLDTYFVKGFGEDSLPQALNEDLRALVRKGKELALFPPGFEDWLAGRKLTPRLLKEFKDMTVSEFVAAMYAKYIQETAKKIDDDDPDSDKKKAAGGLSNGDAWVIAQIRKSVDNPWLAAGLVGVAGGVAWIVKSVINTFWHGFVAGPIAATVNTGMEPITKPVQDRIRQEVNKRLAQRKWIRAWTILLTGEESKRKAANKAVADGKQITGDAARYDMPGVEVEDFSKDTRVFFEEMLAADLRWRGWTLDEVARARQTGFMILFEQPRVIGEQIMGAQSRIDIVKIRQRLEYAPPLLEKGATQEELAKFNELMKRIHLLRKFKSPLDPEIPKLEEQVVELSEAWMKRGVKREDIEAYRESEKHHLVARDRTAFVMASVLYSELYFQEYNRALNNLHQLQQWQELSREMTGFYEGLEEHKEAIEMYFAKKGLKYDVQARIDERGHPLGGPRRPDEMAPLRDRLDTYFRTGDLNAPVEWKRKGAPGAPAAAEGEPQASPAPVEVKYASQAEFQSDLEAIAQKLNAMIERSLTVGADPVLDLQIEATLDAAYTKLVAAPPGFRDYLSAFWQELGAKRWPRISERIELMRKNGALRSQATAGVKLEQAIGRNLFAVNCVLRYRDLKPLPTIPGGK